jgi:two-component system, OmpR family, phosphate regulon sensor histidine kinase PhoR
VTLASERVSDHVAEPGLAAAEPATLVRELESTVEELRIMHEELRVQNEELRSIRDLLDDERHRYSDLFDLAPVGYVITDGDGVVREVNRSAAELLGREARFLRGKPLAALVGAERRAPFRALLREAAQGARWQDEIPFVHLDGGRARLVVQAIGPAPGAEKIIRWSLAAPSPPSTPPSGVGVELASAHALQRTRLSALLDRLHHAVVTVSPSLRVTYANSAALELLTDGRELVGSTLVDPWPEPSLCTIAARMFEHRAEPAEAHVTLEDERRTYEVVALPRDASGDALLVIADVTAHERRQRAEREFVANAAHQLRTPVSAIASAIEVLQGGAKEDPETRDRFLAHLDRQCTRLVRLTRSLLLLARAQALDESPLVEVVPMRPVLDAIARSLRPGAGVQVGVDCPFALAALANRDLLEQAVGNLAENAAKYTIRGEITLSAEAAVGRNVRVVIADTGPGTELPSDGSFRRFYRDPTVQGEGFGLGLAIAAEAVRALRGELEIDSGEDGTRAVVTLPAAVMRRP